MNLYVVERYLPGIKPDELMAAASKVKAMAERISYEGTPVRYLRSTFVPADEMCFCLFEGASDDGVRTVNERAAIPFDRITQAVLVTSEDLT